MDVKFNFRIKTKNHTPDSKTGRSNLQHIDESEVIDQSTSFVVKFVNDGIYWEDLVELAFADKANFAEKIDSQ